MTTLFLALALCTPGQTRELLWAEVNGQRQQVWGWRDGANVRYLPRDNPHLRPSPPPAPPVVAPSQEDGDAGESRGNDPESPDSSLPAYALNGVIETPTTERVIYTNVPSLAPKLAREYGVRVETSGDVPDSYPESDGTKIFVWPIVALAATILIVLKGKRP